MPYAAFFPVVFTSQVLMPSNAQAGQNPIAPVTTATAPTPYKAIMRAAGSAANAAIASNAKPTIILIGRSIPPTLHAILHLPFFSVECLEICFQSFPVSHIIRVVFRVMDSPLTTTPNA